MNTLECTERKVEEKSITQRSHIYSVDATPNHSEVTR